jgi:hypothetical protein
LAIPAASANVMSVVTAASIADMVFKSETV